MDARQLLDAHPRVALGHWPTPLEPADRLRAAIGGPRVWIKRDDCTGLAGGGNKTRKLEYLLGGALAATGTRPLRVLTFGALQSNHARQTAAACAKLGLRCDLVLERQVKRDTVHYVGAGNALLDRLLGATVHVVDGRDEAEAVAATIRAAAAAADEMLAEIPFGGSNAIGALGYVDGTLELAAQLVAEGLTPSRIVLAGSTFGTAAGVIVGAALAELDTGVDVACVARPAPASERSLSSLLAETAALLGAEVPGDHRWTIDDATLGPGYGVVTAETLEAIDLVARTEGVLLDPVYSAKAFALVIGRIRRGELDAAADIVFVHTGGAPALHAYADEWPEKS